MAEVLSTYVAPRARRVTKDGLSSAIVTRAGCGTAARVATLEKSARGVTVADAQQRTRADAVDREATTYIMNDDGVG